MFEYIINIESQSGTKLFKNFMKDIPSSKLHVNLFFCDNKQIKVYNKKYLNSNTATDVIAFSMIEGKMAARNYCLGDAIISVETAKKNAVKYGHILLEEIFLLIIHAISRE